MAEFEARRRWMSILARAERAGLEEVWEGLTDKPVFSLLRRPETGLAMLQGRAGGDGQRFRFGEMTVTRCTVRMPSGAGAVVGHAYVRGRDKRHAELAARFDAMLQVQVYSASIMRDVIEPLALGQAARRAVVARKAAATKVDFFTMVRGNG